MRNAWSQGARVVVLVLATGCGANGTSAGGDAGAAFDAGTSGEAVDLEIIQVLAPPAPVSGVCTYTAARTEPALSVGEVDVAYASLSVYRPTVLILNRSATGITLRSATTKVTDESGGSLVSLLESLCSGEAAGTHAAIVATATAVGLVGLGVGAFAAAGSDQSYWLGACAGKPHEQCPGNPTPIRAWDATALGAWIAGAGVGAFAVVLWTRPAHQDSGHAELRAGPGSLYVAGTF